MDGLILIVTCCLCLLFVYTNGFQDGSSVSATAIGSRAIAPAHAVLLVALCEFLGALLGGTAVADTIHSITSWPANRELLPVLFSGVLAAIVWNFLTRIFRFPSSSTHALVGGIVGAVVSASHSFNYVVLGEVNSIFDATGLLKVIFSLLLSPLVGFLAGYLVLAALILVLARATARANKLLCRLQWLTVAVLAFAHGSNDTQKAMGVLLLTINAAGYETGQSVPLWVKLATGLAMALGVASAVPGIVYRVGSGIYRLRPVHGFVTQFSSAAIVLASSASGGPVSTTQVISSSIVGIGTAARIKGVHWLVARDMLLAWFLTIPASAALAFALYVLTRLIVALIAAPN